MSAHGRSEASLGRLLYTSRTALKGDDAERAAQVRLIAERAAEKNRQAGLTGSLLFVDETFIQVLEGPADRLEPIFETICCDFRHEKVRLLDYQSVRERLFGEWAMACLAEDQAHRLGLQDEMQDVILLAGVNAREAAARMRDLVRRAA